jgi:hypothetical protein
LNKHNDKLATKENPQGQFWALIGLIELSQVQEAEAVDRNAPLAEDAQKVAEDIFGEKPKNAAVEELKKNGQVTTASQLPEAAVKKPGTIGIKKAQRLYTLMSQNKKTNHGFTEEEAKKILTALPAPIEHLRDLENGMYEQFEKWAVGEEDFNDFWKD